MINLAKTNLDEVLRLSEKIIAERVVLQEKSNNLAKDCSQILIAKICEKMAWSTQDIQKAKVSIMTEFVKTPKIMCEIRLNPEKYPSERGFRYVFQYDNTGLKLNFRQDLNY